MFSKSKMIKDVCKKPSISKPDSVGIKITLDMQHTAQHEMLPTQQAQPTLVSLETMLFSDFEIFQAIDIQNKYFLYEKYSFQKFISNPVLVPATRAVRAIKIFILSIFLFLSYLVMNIITGFLLK